MQGVEITVVGAADLPNLQNSLFGKSCDASVLLHGTYDQDNSPQSADFVYGQELKWESKVHIISCMELSIKFVNVIYPVVFGLCYLYYQHCIYLHSVICSNTDSIS